MRKAQHEENKEARWQIKQKISQLDKDLEKADAALKDKNSEIRAQEKKVRESEQTRRQLDRAEEVKRFFLAYKDKLKRRKRERIEETLNQRFKELTPDDRVGRGATSIGGKTACNSAYVDKSASGQVLRG